MENECLILIHNACLKTENNMIFFNWKFQTVRGIERSNFTLKVFLEGQLFIFKFYFILFFFLLHFPTVIYLLRRINTTTLYQTMLQLLNKF